MAQFQFKALTDQAYSDLLLLTISNTEDAKQYVYADSVGIATIGIGFNLRDHLSEVLTALGILSFFTATQLTTLQNTINQTFPPGRDVGNAAMTAINNKMAAFHATNNAIPDHLAFSNFAQMQSVYRTIVPTYEGRVDAWLAGIPNSSERVALVSLSYNGGLGPLLRTAITSGNRAEAWYEIRYATNGGDSRGPGIAKRRYYESQIFGLYDPAITNADAQYKNIFGMYARHEAAIIAYDKLFGGRVAAANTDYHTTIVQATTRLGAGGVLVQDLTGVLKQAADYLIATYAAGKPINQIFVDFIAAGATTEQNVINRSADLTNDLILGSGAGAAAGDGNTLTGGRGNDVIYGGAGNDTINGNDGDDTFYGGTGTDAMTGGAGTDTADYSALSSGIMVRAGATALTCTIIKPSGTGAVSAKKQLVGSRYSGGLAANINVPTTAICKEAA